MHKNVEINSIFCIELHANTSGGYMWYLQDKNDFTKISFLYSENKSSKDFFGCSQKFYFSSILTGKENIEFFYKRSWETFSLKKEIVDVIII